MQSFVQPTYTYITHYVLLCAYVHPQLTENRKFPSTKIVPKPKGGYDVAPRDDARPGVQPLHIINWSKAFETLIDREVGLEIRLCIPCGNRERSEPAWWSVNDEHGELRLVGAGSIDQASTFKLCSRLHGEVEVRSLLKAVNRK